MCGGLARLWLRFGVCGLWRRRGANDRVVGGRVQPVVPGGFCAPLHRSVGGQDHPLTEARRGEARWAWLEVSHTGRACSEAAARLCCSVAYLQVLSPHRPPLAPTPPSPTPPVHPHIWDTQCIVRQCLKITPPPPHGCCCCCGGGGGGGGGCTGPVTGNNVVAEKRPTPLPPPPPLPPPLLLRGRGRRGPQT